MVVVDDTHAATLALTATPPAQLAYPARPLHDVSSLWVMNQVVDQVLALFRAQELVGQPGIAGQLGDTVQSFIHGSS